MSGHHLGETMPTTFTSLSSFVITEKKIYEFENELQSWSGFLKMITHFRLKKSQLDFSVHIWLLDFQNGR